MSWCLEGKMSNVSTMHCDVCKGVSKCIRHAIISVRCAELWPRAGLHVVYTACIATACMLLSSMMRARCRTLRLHGTSYIFYRELSMKLYAELYVGLFRTLYDNFGPYVEE